ncbi:hypothetical protein Emtol_1130 [Emticicia oligotrophica DSM 17448]|uniref:DUF4230 domain-containing protein n=1 Tax=Emticicia oligotrophica (strain DSM 17448 / CIP 109782 / MTCC 6937 / GPTSA100-15) TaxID=929562 RepID=A0ABM5MYP9_EMTOG|nr:DUF4230 domain-containing protein [Emticicia oligotrophica]AFK02279.1 hypothetical protein Emtol_1130 [Emticicia oligotrophica DSM 17448]
MEFLLFLVAIAIGGIAAWQVFNWMYGKKLRDNKDELRKESTLLLERIEKVFKVVMAEGYFTEIYDHSSKKELMGFFKVNKKALVVARAKVSVGFDFGKMKVRRDENSRKLLVEQFPEAEILSIDTDYKFYDIDQGWLHKFNHEDYTNILNEAKKLMQEKALTSDLPKVANRQIGLMMNQLAASMNWELEFKQLPNSEQKTLAELTDFQEES